MQIVYLNIKSECTFINLRGQIEVNVTQISMAWTWIHSFSSIFDFIHYAMNLSERKLQIFVILLLRIASTELLQRLSQLEALGYI
jgi:hypothetical protein